MKKKHANYNQMAMACEIGHSAVATETTGTLPVSSSPTATEIGERRHKFGLRLSQDLKVSLGVEQCPVVRTAADVADVFSDIATFDREVLIAGAIDTQLRLVCWNLLAVGRSDLLVMRIGDAFAGAIRSAASGIFLVHNHPSGSLEASDEDLRLTREVAEAGLLLGYNLVDHVIISRLGHRSLLDRSFLRAHAKRLHITNTVQRDRQGESTVTEWRCLTCKSKNSRTSHVLRSSSKQCAYLPSRCAHCGSFAWLKTKPSSGI